MIYSYYEDPLKSPPTYSYWVPRLAIIFVITKHLVSRSSLIVQLAPLYNTRNKFELV